MSETCPNCGKPVLPSDTVCWHCGYTLPARPKAKPAAALRPRSGSADATPPADYNLRALAVYGLLTLGIVLALWLVMRALGQQPLLVRSAGLRLGDDWLTVTDADLRYTLSLPADWQWLDAAYRDQSEMLDTLLGRQPYINRALRPLGGGVGDVDILGVVIGAPTLEEIEPRPFVVVARGEALRGLSPRAALDRLAGEALPVSDTAIDTRLSRQPQARFTTLDTPNQERCRHLFVADDSAGYLVVACAPLADYPTLRRTLDNILDSVQLLQR